MSESRFKRINPKTNTIFRGDNLEIMRAMPDGIVNVCYIDPPFYTNRDFIENLWGDRESVQDIKTIKKVGFSDKREFFERSIKSNAKGLDAYLEWMRYRITEIERLLKPGGSFFLHIDYRAAHYLKVICDEVFGYKQFKNEIIWVRGNVKGAKAVGHQFARNHDTILYYAKKGAKHTYNRQFIPYSKDYIEKTYSHDDGDGRGPYQTQPVGTRSAKGLAELKKQGRIYTTSNGTQRVKYFLSEMKGIALDDVWTDIKEVQSNSEERTGWPTQKPVALLERILQSATNEGDLVLDCFAGCGTSMHAAHKLKRKWIGIDISPTAIKVNKKRLEELDAKVFIVDEKELELSPSSKVNKAA